MNKEFPPLTEPQVHVLYTRGLINHATWTNVLRAFRGGGGFAGLHAIQTCEVAIEALVERAVDAACAVIQDKLGIKTGDLAAATLSDGMIERELTRYVHAELAAPPDDVGEMPAANHASEAEVRAMDRFLMSLPVEDPAVEDAEDRLPVLSSRREHREDGWWLVYLADGQPYMTHKLNVSGLHVNPLVRQPL